MKILALSFFLIAFNVTSFANDFDWGQNGHRATGQIAEDLLSPKAKKEIFKILQGKSLAMVSTYADEIKSDPRFREFGPWHYVNLPQGETRYNEETAAAGGDLLMAMRKCVEMLKDNNTSREDREFYLKMLVHFVGDLHQPLHAGRGEDKGGNDIQVRWFNEGSNLHRVWDSDMINSYQMSYTELADNQAYLSPKKRKELAQGNFEDWMYESKALALEIYASAEVGEKLGYRYMYDWFPVVREQLQKGGVRLAKVLNEIYK
ncbi:S1/P1 nuclease [Antarcticibacterium flavum]|uniref:S1/P1 nuclease n=1 Tax=Antarcticibacterium flavum TaxID=2058175 RepID=A0A5B7X5Q5_9FLAO|nr:MULTISPECIES: S1/P1 nuclease [Antarcticibacterium]MCM4159757.1 S1/P1 Nuclease [Antarcticibacterium sp. W02-3]QCY70689.1 S1/P1 nuclease [Antarcticibacterium flavum]